MHTPGFAGSPGVTVCRMNRSLFVTHEYELEFLGEFSDHRVENINNHSPRVSEYCVNTLFFEGS